MKKYIYAVMTLLGGAMVFCEIDITVTPEWVFFATKICGLVFTVWGLIGVGAFKDETNNW